MRGKKRRERRQGWVGKDEKKRMGRRVAGGERGGAGRWRESEKSIRHGDMMKREKRGEEKHTR